MKIKSSAVAMSGTSSYSHYQESTVTSKRMRVSQWNSLKIPVVWTIEAPAGTVNGCNYKMLLQDFGEEVTLDEGENVVEFTPTKAGTYSYYCWMGMIRGSISVEE